MNKIIQLVMLMLISCTMGKYAMAASTVSNDLPVGLWRTIDDVSGQPKAVIQISATDDNHLAGKIVKLFKDPTKLCTACDGEKRNQPILGMTVMTQLAQNQSHPDQWTDGKILDPKTGKLYHCNVRLSDNGQKLNVRGYIGMPLFGRSQTWIRVTNPRGLQS